MGLICMGTFSVFHFVTSAHGITSLAPTSMALQSMLETCSNFATTFDLRFNSSKT